jgi:hypothetical protein
MRLSQYLVLSSVAAEALSTPELVSQALQQRNTVQGNLLHNSLDVMCADASTLFAPMVPQQLLCSVTHSVYTEL